MNKVRMSRMNALDNCPENRTIRLLENIQSRAAGIKIEPHPVQRMVLAPMSSYRHTLFLQRLAVFMTEHYNKDGLKVADMECFFCLSRSTLHNRFQRYTGMSAMEYVTWYRIRRACELLRTTDLLIKEIAFEVGYGDANYFSRVFTEEKGCNPSEWRT